MNIFVLGKKGTNELIPFITYNPPSHRKLQTSNKIKLRIKYFDKKKGFMFQNG